MTMWGFEKRGAIVSKYGLHKSRMTALGACWLRQPSLNGVAFSEARCLARMGSRISVKEFEVKA